MKSMQDTFESKLESIENVNRQEQACKDEENKPLKEKLAKLEAELKRATDNDLNYDSPDDGNNNDINYDTECSNEEEKDTNHNTRKYVLNEGYADPNYDSSDNEDRTNDVCYE